jgi:hypothetical protein
VAICRDWRVLARTALTRCTRYSVLLGREGGSESQQFWPDQGNVDQVISIEMSTLGAPQRNVLE